MFSEPMGSLYSLNMGLITGQRYNYLIDTGLGSGSVIPVIRYLSGDNKPVVVINTHHHWDHIWGNFLFGNSLIAAHALCRELADEKWDIMLTENTEFLDGGTEKCLPNLVFSDSLEFSDDSIELFYTPGHSIDCISVFDRIDRVLYAGDNIGDTEETVIPYIETGIALFRDTLSRYREYDFSVCVSGHNRPFGKEIISRMERDLDRCWEKQLAKFPKG